VFPLTGEGGPGLAGEFPQWPQWFSDDHLWLVMATCNYLKETGDFTFLEETSSFQDGAPVSVWEHMRRAMRFTLENRGPHGLPRLGFADWDDTMNLDHGSGLAESVWTGQQFCRAALDFSELVAHLGREAEAAEWLGCYETMRDAVEAGGWDGDYYLRAYDDAGEPVGARGAAQAGSGPHAIALNTQTWAVIGELDRERAEAAMTEAHARLNCEWGLRLMAPAYDGPDERVRGTTTYPPGAKENGGIFCHANAWAIVATAQLGWAERAYQYYRQILPLARADSDTLMTEPYVYCQNICAPEHPHAGRGRNSWLTGTAAWTYVAATQYILGIRPTYTGLRVHPVIPADWPGFSARRTFRGTVYEIEVRRTGPGNAVALEVDGKAIAGDVVPFADRAARVSVTIG
jgi:cellobiose phosphorylase